MGKVTSSLTLALVCSIAVGVLAAQQSKPASNNVPPPWAWGFLTPPGVAAPAAAADAPEAGGRRGGDPTLHTVPGSTRSFTEAQVRGRCPADWFPEDHPEMPAIVACGRQDAMINACSLCHYANGKGRPENGPISGLSESYFIQTMKDFRNGLRKSSDSRKANVARMADFAKAMTDAEIVATAKYFGAIKWTTPWLRVVETDTIPKTGMAQGWLVALEGAEAGREPIGQRLLELPEDPGPLRNPRSGFIVYVPKGAVKKGQALVTAASNKTMQCSGCHGADLAGLGPVPGIAGRSPSYMVRQLFDMQQGSRKGEWSELMKAAVEKLSTEDMLNIAAYLASVPPSGGAQSRATK